MGYRLILPLLYIIALAPDSMAASRKVFFSQTATNFTTTTNGLDTLSSTCSITISNPSTTSQTFTISSLTVSAAGTGPGAATTYTCTGAVSATDSTSCYTSVVLATTNSTQTITWTYPSFPSGTIGTQTITCAGTIDVSDTTATSPGFVFGNGTLLNFIESGTAKSISGGGKLRGSAVFSQTPITIGEGRPF